MRLEKFNDNVPKNAVAIWWLGQAGFAIKTPGGKVVYVDPYLSEAAERLFGFKRLALAPIEAEEVRTDYLVMTHEHADHMDPDAVPIIARNNPNCRFVGPAGCNPGLDEAGISPNARVLLEPNHRYDLGDLAIHTTRSDHGDLSATSLSLLLEFDGIRILFTGDTAFRLELQKPLYEVQPDLLLPCINGAFGNMGPVDAAMFTQVVKPRCAIPCHYGTFAEHGTANPGGFLHACRYFCPEVKALLLRPGERFVCEKG